MSVPPLLLVFRLVDEEDEWKGLKSVILPLAWWGERVMMVFLSYSSSSSSSAMESFSSRVFPFLVVDCSFFEKAFRMLAILS